MKAIHNRRGAEGAVDEAVFKEQKYEKWKQFTTFSLKTKLGYLLFSKSKSTKNESNSQLIIVAELYLNCCFQRAKVRKMKAIHNDAAAHGSPEQAVFKEQKYEKWKQFTTV